MVPFYSVIIPLKNEAENIEQLVDELETVMQGLQAPWELICIDDGSTDGTRSVLEILKKTKPYLRLVFFKKNYGQSSAFDAGFKEAKGQYVITLDGDGQNDPRDIPQLIEWMKDGDLVCGIRAKRKDPLHKRWISKIANYVRSSLCADGVQDTGCSLKIYKRSALNQIKMYQGMHRFLPALFQIEGFKVSECPVNHRERLRGKSNYNFFNRSLNTVFDLFAVYWMKKRSLKYEKEEDL